MKSFELPDWIDPETWRDFEEMRRLIKKPMTNRARHIAVKRLGELAVQGFNPEEVLEQSIYMSWQGLFPLNHQFKREREYAIDRELRVGAGPVVRRTH